MSDFLKDLQKAVDTGEFNSDIANKLNEINEKADEFAEGKTVNEIKEDFEKRFEDVEVKSVEEKDIPEINSNYESRMEEITRENETIQLVAEIINLDDLIDSRVAMMKEKIVKLKEENFNDFTNLGEYKDTVEAIVKKYIV